MLLSVWYFFGFFGSPSPFFCPSSIGSPFAKFLRVEKNSFEPGLR